MKVTTIDLLRHGECEGGEIFRGSTDVALTELGWEQMHGSLAAYSGWTNVVCSPLQRCRAFADHHSRQQALPVDVLDALQEIHFGDWEGVERDLVQKNHGRQLSDFFRSPMEHTPPNGESMVDFSARVGAAFDHVLSRHDGDHVLVVTHGAVIRVAMCQLLGIPINAMAKISVPYASLSRFTVYQKEGRDPWVQLLFHAP